MNKKHSKKFWIIFWLIAALFLVAFYLFLEFKREGVTGLSEKMPVSKEYKTAIALSEYIFSAGEEKSFLILFQNNMEIRPGGGFIGAFGILKIVNGSIDDFQIHDTGIFDKRIPNVIESPKPIQEKMNVLTWKLRDSNFSPDFKVNALQAEKFYKLGDGQEELDGVVAVTSDVLTSFLKMTGPVSLEGYPGTYEDENAIMQLEYQVEKGFEEQGISREERKSIMKELGKEVLSKTMELGKVEKLKLTQIILEDLKQKNILLYFKNVDLQEKVDAVNWDGKVDATWNKDFLMLVDANLGAWKSDYFMKRTVEYSVDLRKEKSQAHLKVTYRHTAEEKNWLTRDYLSYFRVYSPENNWLEETENFPEPVFQKELGKRTFGSYVDVMTGEEKVVKLSFTLSEELRENYALKIQKQIGINDIPWKVKIIQKDGSEKNFEFILNTDITLR